jgi:hypothetical protein
MVMLEDLVAVLGRGEEECELAIRRPRDLMVEFNILTGERAGATGVVRKQAGSLLFILPDEFRVLLGRELTFGRFHPVGDFRQTCANNCCAAGVGPRLSPSVFLLRDLRPSNVATRQREKFDLIFD